MHRVNRRGRFHTRGIGQVSGRRVTLFVEVANVLNRRNERNVPFSIGPRGQLMGVTDSLLPIVPSAGLVIEF